MIRNQQVGGSIPLAGSTIFPHIRKIISSLGQDRRSDHLSHVCPEYPEFCLSSGTNVAQGGGGILGCRTSSIRRVDYEEPSDLDGTVTEENGDYVITLTWTDNSDNESGFKIYLKSGNVFQLLDTVSANTTSYVISENVFPGYYYFYIRAYRADGESTKTDIAAVKVD